MVSHAPPLFPVGAKPRKAFLKLGEIRASVHRNTILIGEFSASTRSIVQCWSGTSAAASSARTSTSLRNRFSVRHLISKTRATGIFSRQATFSAEQPTIQVSLKMIHERFDVRSRSAREGDAIHVRREGLCPGSVFPVQGQGSQGRSVAAPESSAPQAFARLGDLIAREHSEPAAESAHLRLIVE